MILKDKTIFILGISKFDGSIESTSFTTARFLSQQNDVYYIDFPYTLKDYFSKKGDLEAEQFRKRKSAFFSSSRCILDTDQERLKVLILPPLLSINFLPESCLYRKLLEINEYMIAKRIKSIMRRSAISDFVFINSFNFHYPNISARLKPVLTVYHCVDPLISYYDVKHGIISERILLEKSDLVVCTSKQLYREKVQINGNTVFVPNAADISHCSSALDKRLVIHKSLREIEKPIIGYFGNIERRINFDLLYEVALSNLNKNFVFAGPVDEDYVPKVFRALPNVYFVGRIPYLDMPSVLKGFDVAIIPFKIDEVSSTIFPLKLFEYLGAGKPVISTNFNPELAEFTEDTVVYCDTFLEFSKAVKKLSISQNSPELIQERLFVASQNTWERRLTDFSKHLYLSYQKVKANNPN